MSDSLRIRHYINTLLLTIALFGCAGRLMAQDSMQVIKTRPYVALKIYPLAIFIGQMPGYTAHIKGGVEVLTPKRHSFEVTFGAHVPNYIYYNAGKLLRTQSTRFRFFGAQVGIDYRYYFKTGAGRTLGPFIGLRAGFTYLVSKREMEKVTYTGLGSFGNYTVSWTSPPYRARGILSPYAVKAGYAFSNKHFAMHIGASVGYVYSYFWRQYDIGNIEFSHNMFYGRIKRLPLTYSLDFSIGGLF